jgi:glycosyltransferase involved in cell wall biosynthesis
MRISVVIPLYNKIYNIKRALDSVLNQTYPAIEIIVVNDGSTDGSVWLVKELCNPFIQLVHQDNEGVSAARNKGISLAKGEWIALLDADDFWDDNFLQKMVSLHTNFPGANILASNYRFQNLNGFLSNTNINNLPFSEKYEGILSNYFKVAATSSPPLWSSAIIIKKKSLIKIGCFPIGIKSGEDLITWAKLAIQNTIAYTVEPLSTYVLDLENSHDDMPKRMLDSIDFVGKELEILLFDNPKIKGLRTYISHWYDMRASVAIRLSFKKIAFFNILKSLKYNPLNKKAFVFLLCIFLPSSFFFLIKKYAKYYRD